MKNKITITLDREEIHMIDDCLIEWKKGNQAIIRREQGKALRGETTVEKAELEIKEQQEQIAFIGKIQEKFSEAWG